MDNKNLSRSPLSHLSLHLLSQILTYCNEFEGTSALITCKRLLCHLRVFRVDENSIRILPRPNRGTSRSYNDTCEIPVMMEKRWRHMFREIKVTDPLVLLDRLNTRRLQKRIRMVSEMKSNQEGPLSSLLVAYQHGLSIKEISENDKINMEISSNLQFLRFRQSPNQHLVILASYPRCGNSMLRNMIEKVSGVVTGSDTRPDRTLSKALSHQYNLVGEGVTSNSMVDIVKTHWPERRGYIPFKVNKIVLLVRNPWDAIDSYFNMTLTNSHTKSLHQSVYEDYSDFFFEMALNEIETWSTFYRGYIKTAKTRGISLLLVRYEDLVSDTCKEMAQVMNFISPGVFHSERISNKIEEKVNAPERSSYRPRGTHRIGKSFKRYPHVLRERMHKNAGPLLSRLGYNIENMESTPFAWERDLQMKYVKEDTSVSFYVNIGPEIRKSDKFGRALTSWRKSRTNDDRNPFKLVDD